MKKITLLFCFVLIIIIFPLQSKAAEFQLFFNETDFASTNVATVTISLSPAEERINAVAGTIAVLSGEATIRELKYGGSIVSAWIEQPRIDANQVIFSGIIPGGFSGLYMPGLKDPQPGVIMSFGLEISKPGKVIIGFKNAQAYADEGKEQPITFKPEKLEIDFTKPGNLPARGLSNDVSRPTDLAVEIVRLPDNNNEWYAVFSAQDSESGIAYFEVQESSSAEPLTNQWQRTENPYRLQDQTRNKYLLVRAVDQAGNSSIQILEPQPQPWTYEWLYISAVCVLLAIIMLYRRYRL